LKLVDLLGALPEGLVIRSIDAAASLKPSVPAAPASQQCGVIRSIDAAASLKPGSK